MISIVECSYKSLEKAKDAMLRLMHQLNYHPSKKSVMLKPNIVDATQASMAVITDPNVVGGMVLALKEMGISDILIAEGPGFFTKPEHFDVLIKETGYLKLQKTLAKEYQTNVEILNLEHSEREEYPWKFGMLKLPKLCKTHSYINLAKMKTHNMTTVTLGTKNQKGLLLISDKKQFHLGYGGKTELHECIQELAHVIQPDLTIVDATRGLEGTGPISNPEDTRSRRLDLCIGGLNMLEVDNACCQIMGIPVEDVKHLTKQEFTLAPESLPLTPADPPFTRPMKWIKFGNLYLHPSQWACSGCQLTFSRMLRKIMFSPELREPFSQLQQKFPRIDVFIGKSTPDAIPKEHGELVFYGNCSKDTASYYGSQIYIAGCPVDHNKVIEHIFALLQK